MENLYLTADEVANLFRKSPKWVYIHKEKIPGFFKLAGAVLFDREVLQSHLKGLAVRFTEKESHVIPKNRHGLL